MKISKRIITFFLAFAMLVSLSGFASASASAGILVDTASVSSWNSVIAANVKTGVSATVPQSKYWSHIDGVLSKFGVGQLASYDDLSKVVSRLDMSGSGLFGMVVEEVVDAFSMLWTSPDYIVMFDSSLGVYRPYDNKVHLWVVNSLGHFPYYDPDPDSGSTEVESYRTGQWVNMQKVGNQSVLWHVASNYELNEFKEQWADLYPGAKIMETENYYWLVRSDSYTAYVLCDKYGYPYYLPKDGKAAITTPNNYYQETTNQYVDGSTNVNVMDGGSALVGSPIDVNNGIISVGGQLQYIDNITYDASTQTYYVDAHDEYTYNNTTNNYTTNVNTYIYQYHIDYTSITYIGQTSEYEERYEMYYQLPDGRSSADLTAEDLEQLSLTFSDVVQYARTTDNVDMRALYHFDGNTNDSSYWSYATDFDWAVGGSITYMDEGTFGGSLYLDENEHEFTITLPNESDLIGAYTLQFRYYQSYTAAPVQDSYISFGDQKVLLFDGAKIYTNFGAELASIPVGQWNEICISRVNGVRYFYLNGVLLRSGSFPMPYFGEITFHFGDEQQTYKKIDELRVTRAAVYSGEDYTPTSVPFDTNLTLILPDGEYAIADEVINFKPAPNSVNKLSSCGLSDWTSSDVIGNLSFYSTPSSAPKFSDLYSDEVSLFYKPNYTSVEYVEESEAVLFSTASSTVQQTKVVSTSEFSDLMNGFLLPINGGDTSNSLISNWGLLSESGYYTFSVVLSNGMYSFMVFTPTNNLAGGSLATVKVNDITNCDFIKLSLVEFTSRSVSENASGYVSSSSSKMNAISILPNLPEGVEIMYMELSAGWSLKFSFSHEGAVYSSGALEDSPVLAVRTNQTITGYQIGGVRPSYPTKGLVYAMVENGRIVSLQQYAGSAWEEVDGRIWTGKRWIPYSSFDVFTLQDFYDIIGGSDDDYEYIYTESGFWTWFQKQWNKFMDKLDQIIEALGGSLGSDCEHVYTTEIQREATCAEPGHMLYTCDSCGDSYTELIEPAGHDWIVQEHVEDVLDEEGNVVEKGYAVLICSVCDLETKDYGEGPVETDLFDAIGDLLAEGIDWILDKLTQVTDSLSGITDTFNSFVDRIEGMTGEYSLMFGAFLALLPEDLRTLMWLSIIAGVVGLVWKAWAK